MRKTVECRSCELKDKGAQACEFCPERRESPLYKKPWFWILLLTAIAITAINLYQPSKESKNPESPKAFNGECNINVSASIDKSSTGMQELTLFITNLTGKNITSLSFFSVQSNIYKIIERTAPQILTYKGVEIPSGSSVFSSHQFIKGYDGDVELYIYSVDFSDGSKWENSVASSKALRKRGICVDVRSLDG